MGPGRLTINVGGGLNHGAYCELLLCPPPTRLAHDLAPAEWSRGAAMLHRPLSGRARHYHEWGDGDALLSRSWWAIPGRSHCLDGAHGPLGEEGGDEPHTARGAWIWVGAGNLAD